ncbi:cardiolipin synthase [Treponema sp. OMZ 840]|uniref:cardiolipin synthase n=1 Tax=Treponema sp. OMZ 840 TaxID=244313 RepID=UPI003D945A1E
MENFWSIFISILSAINYMFIVFILFFEKQDAGRRFAWILTLSFLPGIGIVLYFLFSGHFFTKTRKMEIAKKYVKEETKQLMSDQQAFFSAQAGKLPNTVMNEYASLIELNLNYGNSPVTFAKSAEIFTCGEEKFAALYRDIAKAEKSVYLQYFIIHKDKTGKKLLDLLCKKAQEGLEVRLLYDDIGSFTTPRSFFAELDNAGGMTLPFFAVKTGSPWSLNFRNHRKIVIIDGKIAYTGGFNVGDEYAGLGKVVWRDTHVRLTGSCVLSLLNIFLVDWYSVASGKKKFSAKSWPSPAVVQDKINSANKNILQALKTEVPDETSRIPAQIIASGPDTRDHTEIKDAMIRMIMSAKKSIYIQTPYFTPDAAFFSAVKIAANSGIKVSIMIPGQWDKFYVRAAAFSFIRDLLPSGVRFYKYPGFIHAKTLIIDEKIVTIGSCNIDSRSFELHYEANVFFYDEFFAQKYSSIFLEDCKKCTKYSLAWLNSRPLLQKAWWGFCRLFTPLM